MDDKEYETYDKQTKAFHQYIGRYITLCSKIEHSCHIFLIEYYVNHNKKTEQFVSDFIARQGFGFRATLKNFNNIIDLDSTNKFNVDKDFFTSSNVNRLIDKRDSFAHGHLNGYDDGVYKLLWFNAHKYKDSDYSITYTVEELSEELKFIKKYVNKVNDVVAPIIRKRY